MDEWHTGKFINTMKGLVPVNTHSQKSYFLSAFHSVKQIFYYICTF